MLERWNPISEFDRMLDEVDRRLSETMGRSRMLQRTRLRAEAPIDVYDRGDALVIKAIIPGATPDDIDIEVESNSLILRGRVGYGLSEEEARHLTWYQREIHSGTFVETVPLPVPVELDNAAAVFDNGILTLTLPKPEQTRVRRIPVRTVESPPST